MPKGVYPRTKPLPRIPELIRFLRLIEPRGECIVWRGYLLRGYGRFQHIGRNGKRFLAHRWAYEFFRGTISDGLQLDHLCRNRACVNPWHLECVTNEQNARRGARATSTHCIYGHEFSGYNLIRTRKGARRCRTCKNKQRTDSYWAKLKSKEKVDE